MTQRIAFDDRRTMLTLPEWREDEDLLASVRACIAAQRAVITPESLDIERAKREVTPEALEAILRSGREVKGVASERDVTNAVVFNANHIVGSVLDRRVGALRRRLDARVARKLRSLFAPGERPSVISSGQFWYPPGGYMGWHTNSGFPA